MRKNWRDRRRAKFMCAVDKRHCDNEHEVKRMLEREANEKHRKSAKCTLFI